MLCMFLSDVPYHQIKFPGYEFIIDQFTRLIFSTNFLDIIFILDHFTRVVLVQIAACILDHISFLWSELGHFPFKSIFHQIILPVPAHATSPTNCLKDWLVQMDAVISEQLVSLSHHPQEQSENPLLTTGQKSPAKMLSQLDFFGISKTKFFQPRSCL